MTEYHPEQELCKKCGFCCDDTLFPHGTIEADEILPFGLVEIYEKGERSFKLPCPHFNGLCTIYHQGRPEVCDSFQCLLFEDVMVEETSLEEALQLVEQIKAQKKRMCQLLSAYPGKTLREKFRAFQRRHSDQRNSAEFKLSHKDLLTEWVLYNTRLKRFYID